MTARLSAGITPARSKRIEAPFELGERPHEVLFAHRAISREDSAPMLLSIGVGHLKSRLPLGGVVKLHFNFSLGVSGCNAELARIGDGDIDSIGASAFQIIDKFAKGVVTGLR